MTTTKKLDREQILQLAGGYRFLAVLGAAAELNLFTLLGEESLPAEPIAIRLRSNLRATTVLLDALAALGLLDKQGENYSVPADLRPWLTRKCPRHRAADGAAPDEPDSHVVAVGVDRPQRRAGRAAGEHPRGRGRSRRVHRRHAQRLRSDCRRSGGPARSAQVHVICLDVGGASGTWTLAFLRAVPGSRATIFDLPDAIEQARQRIAAERFWRPRESCGGRFL